MTTTWLRRAVRVALVGLPLMPVAVMAQDADPAPDQPRYGSFGLDTALMDRDVVPGDDFFSYMEGVWVKTTRIPDDKARVGYNYDLDDKVEEDIRAIAEQAVAHPDTPGAKRIAAVYSAWMDEKGIAARGLAPLQPWLAKIAAVHTRRELMELMAEPGYSSPIAIGISSDFRNPARYVVTADQGELGLPAREYYLDPGEKYAAVRSAYVGYIEKIFTLAGIPDGAKKAQLILALETAVARSFWEPEKLRDPKATYNPVLRAKLAAYAPGVEWNAMLARAGLAQASTVIVGQPSAIRAIGARLAYDPVDLWKDYLTFHFISGMAAYLPPEFDEAHFAFYGRTLSGIPTQKARWKRGVSLLNHQLGEEVGQIYLKAHWSPAAQQQMDEMIGDLRVAYADKIDHAAWMDAPTRKAALAKLAAFEARVAGPRTFIDYTDFHPVANDPLANAMESQRFEWALRVKRFPKPVDRGLWDMTPQTVNAYYDPTTNQVTFPAAELQPPFFDPNADPAVNYGGAGATIGHEMGHGFDDEGRQFDGQGRLTDWWTPLAAKRYTAHAQNLVKQFDAYEPIAGVHIKGALTLGENLADLGGLEAAYAAYHRYLVRHGEAPEMDGMTGDQRFFLAFAQSWQGKARDEALRQQLLSDPHSPEIYRVNGIVRNFDPWYAAFDVKPDNKLYLPPEQRVRVW